MISLSTIIITLSSISLLYSALVAWHIRGVAKSVGYIIPLTFGSPIPVPIIIQTLLSCFLLLVGITMSASPLKEISWASEMRTRSIDSEDSRLSFASMRHRGSVLFNES